MGAYFSRLRADSGLHQLAHSGRHQESHDQPELTRDELLFLLNQMGKFIDRKTKRTVVIVAIGGAVNVLALETRDVTHDLDWFSTNLTEVDTKLLSKALAYTNRKAAANGTPSPPYWFNNHTTLFIPLDVCQQITTEALEQKYNVFNTKKFKVLAAPWQYAVVS